MSKGNTTETDVLNLVFNKVLAAHLGVLDTTGNASLFVGLHTANPDEAGVQTTSECAYTSYLRVEVARTAGGWTVSGNQAKNTAGISFPKCTGGTETAKYVSIGTVQKPDAGQILYSGALDDDLDISLNIIPQFEALALVVEED